MTKDTPDVKVVLGGGMNDRYGPSEGKSSVFLDTKRSRLPKFLRKLLGIKKQRTRLALWIELSDKDAIIEAPRIVVRLGGDTPDKYECVRDDLYVTSFSDGSSGEPTFIHLQLSPDYQIYPTANPAGVIELIWEDNTPENLTVETRLIAGHGPFSRQDIRSEKKVVVFERSSNMD